MTTGQKIEHLRKKSTEEYMQADYEDGIKSSHELIALLDESRVHQRLAAFQWELVARMYLRMNRPVEAEMAARKSLDGYLRYKTADVSDWDPEGDSYLADFRMTLALSLAYQKRYAEAMPYAEQWERVHLKVRGPDDPFVKDVVARHMKRMRARLAGLPVSENGQDEHTGK
jgi:tetratricopeptide (TPR) repeat protein